MSDTPKVPKTAEEFKRILLTCDGRGVKAKEEALAAIVAEVTTAAFQRGFEAALAISNMSVTEVPPVGTGGPEKRY